jgi:cytochrome c peroxidase
MWSRRYRRLLAHRSLVVIAMTLTAGMPAPSAGCEGNGGAVQAALTWKLPQPPGASSAAEVVELGRKLFHDTRLSADKTVSCATCHRPESAFADRQSVSIGVNGRRGFRNAPSLLNVAYVPRLFWDGRAASLEEQVQYPILNPGEMGMTKLGVERELEADIDYRRRFERVFGDAMVTYERVARAIAAFERTLIRLNSPFDAFYVGQRLDALTKDARRGWRLFTGKAGCIQCHTVNRSNPFFSDFEFHNTGVGAAKARDAGLYSVTQRPRDRGRFRTPSLRNVAVTPPYMHDGRLETLEEVMEFYRRGGGPNPRLDSRIRPLALSEEQVTQIIRFLEALTDECVRGQAVDKERDAGQLGRSSCVGC